ncbi:hypothetical protein [Anaerocolumna sp. MB42-C2]|uniref:hypothetical protein n=1 Tax=Anaerocolumna sp. MB42-C2 TaxID=3070997 RepID=UPI0027DF898E|nr:hypothetical protein [Anaerocolumna sp. MB42-C2]WMJ85863.1 hypothetical protein RBU59_17550 [Anaerocolumna sp. MB42-C2]
MKIGTLAVPGKESILLPAPTMFHNITLLYDEMQIDLPINYSKKNTIKNIKNEPLHLKDSFLHLKTYFILKFALEK